MAFNTQEQQLIRWGAANGKTKEEVMLAISNLRAGIQPKQPEQEEEEKPSFLADLGGDVVETAQGLGGAISQFGQTSQDIAQRQADGETGFLGGTFQRLGAVGRLVGETAGQAVTGLGKAILPQKAEEAIGETVGAGVRAVVESPFGQEVGRQFEQLTPEQQRNVEAAGGIAEGVLTIGFAPILGRVNVGARTFLKEADDVLARSRQSVSDANIPKITVPETKSLLKDVRFQLSDIDPQVRTALERSNFDEVNRYFQQAKNAATDPAKATPFDLVALQAEQANKVISEALSNATKGKQRIISEVGTEPVPGNIINDVMSSSIQKMQERFGAKIAADGTIAPVQGRTLVLDSADQKLVSQYVSEMNALGVSPTARQIDDFIDRWQGQLYKQTQTFEKVGAASDPVISELRQATGSLNDSLKNVVGNGYSEVNSRIRGLLTLQDEINRGLGVIRTVDAAGNPIEIATKGAGFVKRLFSPSGENTRRVFEQIKQETGIDLFKDATLAKFAMESAGDVRQRSLLQNLGVAVDTAAELDLTKPLSLIKFIRERADLDAQELANEVIRRSNAASSAQ